MGVLAFTSSEGGAPVLSGTVGALTDMLYACLVTGFNLITLDSLTRDVTTVTGTLSTGHGFATGQTVRIAGANEPDYNGDVVVTVLSATQFTYEITGTPTTPATGTITAKRAPLGWSRPYSDTNKAVFQASAGTQFFLRIRDGGYGTGGACEAYANGYETMTDVDTGAGAFPLSTQGYGGKGYWRKSWSLDSSARPWWLIGDDRFFYLSVRPYTSEVAARQLYYFGDIVTFKEGDAFQCAIAAGWEGENSTQCTRLSRIYGVTGPASVSQAYIARSYTQVGSSVAAVHCGVFYNSSPGYYLSGAEGLGNPNLADLGYYMHPILAYENGTLRGRLPGLFGLPFVRRFSHWETLTNVEGLAGKTLRVLNAMNSESENDNANYGQVLLDVTGPWR